MTDTFDPIKEQTDLLKDEIQTIIIPYETELKLNWRYGTT